MALFSNFVQSVFGTTVEPEPELEESNPDNCNYLVKSKHKLSDESATWLFDTKEDLNTFMQDHCPTAHLNYVRTEVFAMDFGAPKLMERHEHFTGNVSYETGKFNEEAESRGLNEPRVSTYPNISSAVTAVAYFN